MEITRQLLYLWAFFIFFGLSLAGDLSKYDVKLDIDCAGNDLGRQDDKNADECDELCKDHNSCVGFLLDNSNQQCYLKSRCDSSNYVEKDNVDSYTLQYEVCTWDLHSSCVYRYEYQGNMFEACSWKNWENKPLPWCAHHEVYQTNQWSDCIKSCRNAHNEVQYGSPLPLYPRSRYDHIDGAAHYTMVYEDPVEKSGLITAINMDVAAINRHISIGVFKKTGLGNCDFMLTKEVPLHRMADYQPHVQVYGLQTITLNPADYLAVSPDYHLGYYWNLKGTLYYVEGFGHSLCGFYYDTHAHPFIPYETLEYTSMFQRHYSFDVIIQYSNTDINWLLNAAFLMNVTSGGTTYNKKEGSVAFTDGDYATCETAGAGAFMVDLNRIAAVSAVKLRANTDADLTIKLKDTSDAAESTPCGTYGGDWSGSSAVVTCSDGARGRYLDIEFSGASGDIEVCEVEVLLTTLYETCMGDWCYYVTSEQEDSPGAADVVCKRYYADAAVFEPTDQSHWDTVSDWYTPLFQGVVDDTGRHNAVVGIKYAEGAWKLQSSGATPPSIQREGDLPSFYTYMVMDAVSGNTMAEQNGISHYCLCQVPSTTYNAEARVVFKAVAGSSVNVYSLWASNESTPAITAEFSPELTSMDPAVSETLVSPILDCINWTHVKEVRMSMYKDDMEVAFALFEGGEKEFFTMDRLKGSSYVNLPTLDSMANIFSVEGSSSGDEQYRFQMNQETYGCDRIGWMMVTDHGHSSECHSETSGPQFLYSNRGSSSKYYVEADMLVMTLRTDDGVLGHGKDTCKGEDDGLYHSAMGCNVFVKCTNEILTIHTCRAGTQFDSSEGECVSESTTCTGGNVPTSCQTGCPSVDPCTENQGSCIHTDGATGWECQCVAGYEGALCESEVDECKEVTCSGRGNCTDLFNDYICECEPDSGYEGKDCATDIDECGIDGSCVNGNCTNEAGTYSCDCEPGYSGGQCTVNINECEVSNPCEHGNCTDVIGSYNCTCEEGYRGDTCGENINECEENNPCVHGNCTDIEGSYECDCEDGYTGDHCSINIDECEVSNPCEHGVCRDLNGSYNCTCDKGYKGDTCGENINECEENNPCVHGNCTDKVGSYECDCEDGYKGDHCTVNINECEESNPCEHGNCVDVIGSFNCTCDTGYKGDTCGENINECEENNPCVNGTCTDKEGSYECDCEDGFTGKNCNEDFDECSSSPCQNGQCNDAFNSYTCDCSNSGFVGLHCEATDHCHGHNDCTDKGECHTGESGFSCTCTEGYTGDRCQFENKCITQSIGCNGNGNCEVADNTAGWRCLCNDTHIGDECQLDNPCEPNPCSSGGECEVVADQENYYCDCGDFIGDNCDIDHPCRPNPCVHGTCGVTGSPGNYGYVCGCDMHFTGANCNIGPCHGVDCNNGQCIEALDTDVGYTCECTDPYFGSHCDEDPCRSSPCHNEGVCQLSATATSGYACECKWPYGGVDCSEDTSKVSDEGSHSIHTISATTLVLSCVLALL